MRRLIASALAAVATVASLAGCAVSSTGHANSSPSATQPGTPALSRANVPTQAVTAPTQTAGSASTQTAGPASTQTPSSTQTAGSARVIVTCTGESAVAPQTYVLTCADANTRLTHLMWSGWGTSTAHAQGTLEMNSCTPNCAQGAFRSYPATVTALGSTVVGPGQTSYTEVQVSAAPLTGNNTWHVTGNGPG